VDTNTGRPVQLIALSALYSVSTNWTGSPPTCAQRRRQSTAILCHARPRAPLAAQSLGLRAAGNEEAPDGASSTALLYYLVGGHFVTLVGGAPPCSRASEAAPLAELQRQLLESGPSASEKRGSALSSWPALERPERPRLCGSVATLAD